MERPALMFLLDTDVVIELRKGGGADPALTGWAGGVARDHMFLSAISLLELEGTAARLAPREKARSARLYRWIDEQVVPAFEGRVIPVDAAVVRRRRGLALADARDALIAATALDQGLTIATRRTAAFKPARVKLLDPWTYTSDDDVDWRQAARDGPHWLKNLFVRV